MTASLPDNGIIRKCEHLTAVFGRFLGGLLPFNNSSGLFFYFPFCHVGGAERVHADIVKCFAKERPWVFFCKWSRRPGLLRGEFAGAAATFGWSLLLKYTYPLSAGVMAGFINRHPNAVVFGCNTLFFYKMLPLLAPHVRKIDLLHAFGGGAEDFSIPVVDLLDVRVVITGKTGDDLASQYRSRGIERLLLKRIVTIENRVAIPAVLPRKAGQGPLKILYVGRDSAEKRVHLVGEIAALCSARGLAAEFTLVGDISPDSIGEKNRRFCRFTDEIGQPDMMEKLYLDAHLLLLVSSREGFPLVIMEAMAHGVVPLSTDVGGIRHHLRSGINGWLVENHPDENQIARGILAIIEQAAGDRALLEKVSAAAHDYAARHFSGSRFCGEYRSLILNNGDRERDDA